MPEVPLVLLIEHEPNLGRLFVATLEDEGIEVELVIAPEDPVAEVRRVRPNLLVLDLAPPGEQSMEALDRLRTDEVTRAVPVLVITTLDSVVQESLASYNVRASLSKPFDLDQFVDTIREHAVDGTMLSRVERPRPAAGDFRDYAEHVLAERSRHMIFRWMQRIRSASPWRERNLSTEELIDHAPSLLRLIDVRLHYRSHEEFLAAHPEALERAAAHARDRMSQEIGAVAAVEEYVLIREEIWRELRAQLPEPEQMPGYFETERAINGALDAAILATLRAYAREANGG